jgi:tRNA G18 (ribose-2'-O)-methylase SpoU
MSYADRTIVAVLPDIRSLHNVGSMFRTADAGGVSHVYLVGYTPTPVDRFERKRAEIAKTALGAEEKIPWSSHDDLKTVIDDLRSQGFQIVMCESGTKLAVPYDEVSYGDRVALIVGSEVEGIPQDILPLADTIIEIPLLGTKESLNVSVAFGIALYGVRRRKRS